MCKNKIKWKDLCKKHTDKKRSMKIYELWDTIMWKNWSCMEQRHLINSACFTKKFMKPDKSKLDTQALKAKLTWVCEPKHEMWVSVKLICISLRVSMQAFVSYLQCTKPYDLKSVFSVSRYTFCHSLLFLQDICFYDQSS